jgi:hypothetical protein
LVVLFLNLHRSGHEKRIGEKAKANDLSGALYTIIDAMQSYRIFERFGFSQTTSPKKNGSATLLTTFAELQYDPGSLDWIDTNSGNPLSSYVSDQQTDYLLENCINYYLN